MRRGRGSAPAKTWGRPHAPHNAAAGRAHRARCAGNGESSWRATRWPTPRGGTTSFSPADFFLSRSAAARPNFPPPATHHDALRPAQTAHLDFYRDRSGAAWRRRVHCHTQPAPVFRDDHRSEEHTSELQSPCNLVCRLLLEKKKRTQTLTYTSDQDTHESPKSQR